MVEHKMNHFPDKHRFSMIVDGLECLIDYRIITPNVWEYYHTFVPPELRGRKLAEEIATQALNYARMYDIQVIPTCPYIARFIKLYPEYQSLVYKG